MKIGFPILTIFMILIILLALRLKHLNKLQSDAKAAYYDRERRANATPAKDIENLNYITIPLEKFPLNQYNSKDIKELENTLQKLSLERILILSQMSNTDLKETYGVPNLETMQKIGEKGDELLITLDKYAKALLEENDKENALKVLEFAVGIKSDISSTYELLAKLYKENDNSFKLDLLIDQAKNNLPATFQKNLVSKLEGIKKSK